MVPSATSAHLARWVLGAEEEVSSGVGPKIRRGVIAATLAVGTLLGGVGVGHALAATRSAASPSPSKSSGSSGSSTTHHCPNDSSSSSSA